MARTAPIHGPDMARLPAGVLTDVVEEDNIPSLRRMRPCPGRL